MTNNHEENSKQTVENAKALIVDSIAETMDLYGVTRSAGTLYGTMYFEEDMTLDEMREKLGMSKPSMSTGVKKLQNYDIVKQTFRKGTRRQTFVAEKDFFNFFSNFFTKKWLREAKINMEAIKQAQIELKDVLDSSEVEEETKQEAKQIFHQLEDSKPYYLWLQKLVDAIESGEIFDLLPIDSKK